MQVDMHKDCKEKNKSVQMGKSGRKEWVRHGQKGISKSLKKKNRAESNEGVLIVPRKLADHIGYDGNDDKIYEEK